MNREIILQGEGANMHVLEGSFTKHEEFFNVKEALLKHETPSGLKAEHETLYIPKGFYFMERQIEFNPFDSTVSNIFD